MPNRSSKRFHDHHKRMLARIDGNYCLICRGNGTKRAPPEVELEIDHARTDLDDSDTEYWEYDVTCLLCKTCNLSLRNKSVEEHCFIQRHYRALNVCEKEKERKSGAVSVGPPVGSKTVMDIVDFMHGPVEMQAKSYYEPKFARFVWERLVEFEKIPEKELLDSFSYQSRASQVTLKRYLDSYCSPDGPCRRSKDGDGNIIILFKFPVHRAGSRNGHQKNAIRNTAPSNRGNSTLSGGKHDD